MEAQQPCNSRFLDDDDLLELLREDEDIVEEKSRDGIIGYPTRPLYRELGSQLQQWLDTGEETINEISPCLKRIKSLFPIWSNDELLYSVRDILVSAGPLQDFQVRSPVRGLGDQLVSQRRKSWTYIQCNCRGQWMYVPTRTLRSSSSMSIRVPPRKTTMPTSSKSFSSVALNIWNALPNHHSSIPNLPAFRRALKHHLFLLAYPDSSVKSGKRGLLDLLGMRKTYGSCSIWPPPRKILEHTFCEKHSPETDSILSVGARALAKHCHRDATLSWWGNCTGSEKAKSDHASKKMKEILDNATWLNIHLLPHDVKILEARQENGYGARWTSDGRQFRGFVEPQMVDGHEVGWKH